MNEGGGFHTPIFMPLVSLVMISGLTSDLHRSSQFAGLAQFDDIIWRGSAHFLSQLKCWDSSLPCYTVLLIYLLQGPPCLPLTINKTIIYEN